MDEVETAALAGFIAGEAYIGLTKSYQWKPYIKPRVSIQLHERDREILEKIQKLLNGEGKITDRSNRPHSTLTIQTKEALAELVDVLDKCDSVIWKSSDKCEQYQRWRKAVEMHLGPETTTTEERMEMAEIAKNLNKDAGHNNVDWDEFIERLENYED